MSVLLKTTTLVVSAIMACAPISSIAQDAASMTADEIKERFSAQKTRSLDLAIPSEAGAFVKVFMNETANTPFMFEVGSAALIGHEAEKFEILCEDLILSGNVKFEIFGLGDAALGVVLGQQRAEVLKTALVESCGVSEGTFVALARN